MGEAPLSFGLVWRWPGKTTLLHLSPEGRFVDTKLRGRSGPVAVVFTQRIHDRCRFSLIPHQIDRFLFAACDARRNACQFDRQVFWFDFLFSAQYKGVLDDVFQFSNVAGEVMLH